MYDADAIRRYRATPKGREANRRAASRYQARRPRTDHHRARALVAKAVENGQLVRRPCHCGVTRVQAHHPDYSKPLDVVWLCRPHHDDVHRKE